MPNSRAVEAALNGHPESWRETIEGAVERAEPFIRQAEQERIREALERESDLRREAERHYREQGEKAAADGCALGASAIENAAAALLDSEQVDGVEAREALILSDEGVRGLLTATDRMERRERVESAMRRLDHLAEWFGTRPVELVLRAALHEGGEARG